MTDASLFNQARALLFQFERSKAKALRFETAGLKVFFSRDGAFRAWQAPAAALPVSEGTPVNAPHLATITGLVPSGTMVTAGEAVAMLRVLDRATPLLAEACGAVAWDCDEGQLVEFGQRLLSLH